MSCALCCQTGIREVRWAYPRKRRPHQTSNRGKRTLARNLRCVPKTGSLADAGMLLRVSPPARWYRGRQSSLRRAIASEQVDSRELVPLLATERAARTAESNLPPEYL